MYVVLSIDSANKIEIHSMHEKLTQAKSGLHSIAYKNVGCSLENISNTEIRIYRKVPGYVYGNYKTLIKTIYIVPFQDIDPKSSYDDVITELRSSPRYQVRQSR